VKNTLIFKILSLFFNKMPKLATDPPVSEAQRRAMWAAKSGHSTLGIPQSVGKEFAEADPGGKLPSRARDMNRNDWRAGLRWLLKFFAEEMAEPEHQEGEENEQEAQDKRGAGVAFITKDGKALFLRRASTGDHAGEWAFPGGAAEYDESPEQVAIREALEETGHDCEGMDCGPMRVLDHSQDEGSQYITFAHLVPDAFDVDINNEHTGFKWAPLDNPPNPLHPGVASTLDKFLSDESEESRRYKEISETRRNAPHFRAERSLRHIRDGEDAWTDEARKAALEARRAHQKTLHGSLAKAGFNPLPPSRIRGSIAQNPHRQEKGYGRGGEAQAEKELTAHGFKRNPTTWEHEHPSGSKAISQEDPFGRHRVHVEHPLLKPEQASDDETANVLEEILDYIKDRPREDEEGEDYGTSEGARKRWEGGGHQGVEIEPTKHYTESHSISSSQGSKVVPSQRYNVYQHGQHLGTVATHTHAEQKGGRHGGGGPRGYSTGRTLLRWSTSPTKQEGQSFPPRGQHGLRSRNDAIEDLVRSHRVHKGAQDSSMAHDYIGPWSYSIALDRDPNRRIDDVGRMHVDNSVLSKAVVSPYFGKEINGVMKDEPGWVMLDPDKKYHLLRDPKELEKAVDTFNGLPLLWQHKPATAEDHPAELTIGATGTNARFENPNLINDLVIWPKFATQAVEDGEKKSLSCGYGYRAVMEPGEYNGQRYDGRMVDIKGNHVALVHEPRVPGAMVGDSMPDAWEIIASALMALDADSEFEEGEHPRDKSGQFTSKGGGESRVKPSIKEGPNPKIKGRYDQLRKMDKDALIRNYPSRLDVGHLRKESKSIIISGILQAEFTRRELEAWNGK